MNRLGYRLRTVLAALMLLVFVILLLPVTIVQPRHNNWNYRLARLAGRPLCAVLGIQLAVTGGEHLQARNAIFVSNHQHRGDAVIGLALLPPRTLLLVKRPLLWLPLVGQLLWMAGNIFVRRDDDVSREAALREMLNRIEDGETSVWLYPEGTRHASPGLKSFEPGACFLSRQTGRPLIPIVAEEFFDRVGEGPWGTTPIAVRVLPPLDPARYNDDETMTDACRELMAETLAKF